MEQAVLGVISLWKKCSNFFRCCHKTFFRMTEATLNSHFFNRTEELQTRLELGLGVVGFDHGGHQRDVMPSGGNLVGKGDTAHIDIVLPPNLVLWQDDLTGLGVVGVGNRMVQNADSANDLRRKKIRYSCYWDSLSLFIRKRIWSER